MRPRGHRASTRGPAGRFGTSPGMTRRQQHLGGNAGQTGAVVPDDGRIRGPSSFRLPGRPPAQPPHCSHGGRRVRPCSALVTAPGPPSSSRTCRCFVSVESRPTPAPDSGKLRWERPGSDSVGSAVAGAPPRWGPVPPFAPGARARPGTCCRGRHLCQPLSRDEVVDTEGHGAELLRPQDSWAQTSAV